MNRKYINLAAFLIAFSFIASPFLGLPSALASETLKGAEKDYEAFTEDMSQKYDNVSKELEQLKVKAQEKGSKVKAETIEELEASQEKIEKKLAEMKSKSKKQWKSMKKSLSESIDSLHAKIQKSLKD